MCLLKLNVNKFNIKPLKKVLATKPHGFATVSFVKSLASR